MRILGISCFYHDSAAALIEDGKIIAACQEERFSRKKFDPSFPIESIRYCLREANIDLHQIDEIVYYEKPLLTFERLLDSIVSNSPRSLDLFLKAMPIWGNEKLNMRKTLQNHFRKNFPDQKIPTLAFSQHHLSHAASAFYPSPFQQAAVLCLDGVGEWATTSAWRGDGSHLTALWEQNFPHSLGLFYSAFTYYCGFKVNSGEYKLMGLAPFGKPRYAEIIKKELITIHDDGSFHLNMKYFAFDRSLQMITPDFEKLFGHSVRKAESEMPQIYKDVAASVQKVTEEILVKLAKKIQRDTGAHHLCLAGGVALNCVANSVLWNENIFENIWVQPAAGDAGGSLGAALASYYLQNEKPRHFTTHNSAQDSMQAAFLGPEFDDSEIEKLLQEKGLPYHKFSADALVATASQDLENQKVIGWFQGRMEFGPRSLGARSILGDARSPQMQSFMNQKIKFRESFRPFAPAVLAESCQDLFESETQDSYMLFTSQFKDAYKSSFPAVTHVDGSARVQKVDQNKNPLFYRLISHFKEKTGCPLIINTSFNVRGEPIVCTPLDALRCFILTDIDSLFLGSYYLSKADVKVAKNDPAWRTEYELD